MKVKVTQILHRPQDKCVSYSPGLALDVEKACLLTNPAKQNKHLISSNEQALVVMGKASLEGTVMMPHPCE